MMESIFVKVLPCYSLLRFEIHINQPVNSNIHHWQHAERDFRLCEYFKLHKLPSKSLRMITVSSRSNNVLHKPKKEKNTFN